MKPTPLKDVAPGSIVFTSERLDDEVRETFYIREAGAAALRYAYDVKISRIGFIQFDPTTGKPRVQKLRTIPCDDPGEAHGLTPCFPLDQSRFAGEVRELWV